MASHGLVPFGSPQPDYAGETVDAFSWGRLLQLPSDLIHVMATLGYAGSQHAAFLTGLKTGMRLPHTHLPLVTDP